MVIKIRNTYHKSGTRMTPQQMGQETVDRQSNQLG